MSILLLAMSYYDKITVVPDNTEGSDTIVLRPDIGGRRPTPPPIPASRSPPPAARRPLPGSPKVLTLIQSSRPPPPPLALSRFRGRVNPRSSSPPLSLAVASPRAASTHTPRAASTHTPRAASPACDAATESSALRLRHRRSLAVARVDAAILRCAPPRASRFSKGIL